MSPGDLQRWRDSESCYAASPESRNGEINARIYNVESDCLWQDGDDRAQIPAHPAQTEAVLEYYHFYFLAKSILFSSHPARKRSSSARSAASRFLILQLKCVSIALFRTHAGTRTHARSSRLNDVVRTQTDRTIQVIKVCEKRYPSVFFSSFPGDKAPSG